MTFQMSATAYSPVPSLQLDLQKVRDIIETEVKTHSGKMEQLRQREAELLIRIVIAEQVTGKETNGTPAPARP